MPVSSNLNPDLKEERDKVKFSVEEFTNWYYGGSAKVEEKRFYGKVRIHKKFLCQIKNKTLF